jgi:hypothetical protein
MMQCPECGGEYRDGFTQCADCEVALVPAPPPGAAEAEEPDVELVSVLETGDPAEIALAESLLLEAGIPYAKHGDRVQDLFGIGRVGGFNVLTGPAHLLVPVEHAEAAGEMLRDLAAPEPLEADALETDGPEGEGPEPESAEPNASEPD